MAVELVEGDAADEMELFFRRGGRTVREREQFEPFMLATDDAIKKCPIDCRKRNLQGGGALNVRASFSRWKDCLKAKHSMPKKQHQYGAMTLNCAVVQTSLV